MAMYLSSGAGWLSIASSPWRLWFSDVNHRSYIICISNTTGTKTKLSFLCEFPKSVGVYVYDNVVFDFF